jgi:hypothetical protein
MPNFTKGLKPELINLLNEAYDRGGWWKDILADPDLHIGIRNKYLNVYYQGNSLVLIKNGPGGLSGQTHYKYLLHPGKKQKPFILADGSIQNLEELFIHHLNKENLDLMKRASTVYAGEEKKGIQWILKDNQNIIDMEIALTQEAEKQEDEEEGLEENGRPTAPRLDFAALRQFPEGIKLVFFEAKIFYNKELRAKEEKPRVVDQIMKYENLIKKHMSDMKESYLQVCSNLVELKGIHPDKKNFARSVLREGALFTISTHPWLVIFGFDNAQKKDEGWEKHLQILKTELKERVLLRGKPKGFTNGISFQP